MGNSVQFSYTLEHMTSFLLSLVKKSHTSYNELSASVQEYDTNVDRFNSTLEDAAPSNSDMFTLSDAIEKEVTVTGIHHQV